MAITYLHVTVAGATTKTGATWATAMDMAAWFAHMTNTVIADTVYYTEEGTYTLSAALTLARDGTAATPICVVGVLSGTTNEGVNVVYSDYAFLTHRPLLAGGANAFALNGADYWNYKNLRVTSSAANGFQVGNYCTNENVKCTNNGGSWAFYDGAQVIYRNCEGTSTGYVFRMYSGGRAMNCYAHDSPTGFYLGNYASIINSIADTCSTAGVQMSSKFSCSVVGNTIYGCGTGIAASTAYIAVVANNIISQCTKGAEWTTAEPSNVWAGNLWNNTTDVTLVTKGITDTSVAVGTAVMSGAVGGDFTLTHEAARSTAAQLTTDDGLSAAAFHATPGVDQTGDFPAVAAVLSTDTTDGTVGTYHPCLVAEVLSTVSFGAGSAETGTYHEAVEAEVQKDVAFGAGSALTGAYSSGSLVGPSALISG